MFRKGFKSKLFKLLLHILQGKFAFKYYKHAYLLLERKKTCLNK